MQTNKPIGSVYVIGSKTQTYRNYSIIILYKYDKTLWSDVNLLLRRLLGLEALRIIASTHRVRSMNGEVVKDIICKIPAHHLLLFTGFHQLTVGFLGFTK